MGVGSTVTRPYSTQPGNVPTDPFPSESTGAVDGSCFRSYPVATGFADRKSRLEHRWPGAKRFSEKVPGSFSLVDENEPGTFCSDMFASAMQRLQREGVQVSSIRGVWIEGTDSVNAAQYMSNIGRGMSPQQAAANTWTGRMAARYGYTNVGVPSQDYSSTVVLFGR